MGKAVVDKLWEKLPAFMRGHMTVRATIRGESDDYAAEPWTHRPIETANLITSQVERYPYGIEYHRPVLDLDFEAELLPSSTPGHYHLFLGKLLTKQQYYKLLQDLADAGIIQRGFADSSLSRGASSVRLPWIKKNDWAANQGDPDASVKKLQAELAAAEAEAARLRVELDRASTVW